MGKVVKFPPLDPDDLGTDVACTDDVSPVWGLASGKLNVAMGIYRRLTSDPGSLHYRRSYGYNVRNLLNAELGAVEIAEGRAAIAGQCIADERVQSAKVVLNFTARTKTLDIKITLETAIGTFDLVLRASSVTVDILLIDGIPVAVAVRPDLVAADEVIEALPVIFPDAPPALGLMSGAWTMSLDFSAAINQPVGEWISFSGMASASGSAGVHANAGASSAAPSGTTLTRYLVPACTLRKLRLSIVSNTRTVDTTFSVYKNGVITGITVTVPGLSTASASSSASIDCNGTTDMIALVSSGSPTGTVIFGATLETGFKKFLKFAGTHSYDPLSGDVNYHADVAGGPGKMTDATGYIPAACTINALRVGVVANNSLIAPVVFTVWKNGAPTSMTVTVPAGSTSPQIDAAAGHALTFNGTTDTLDLRTERTGGQPADDVQLFTAVGPATWTKPLNAETVTAFELGAGGGTAGAYTSSGGVGGGTGGGFGAHPTSAPGGGGGGGAQQDVLSAATLGATVPVTVGGGGDAGTPSQDGGDGGYSAFGSLFATGGKGSPHAGAGGVETGIGGTGGTGNAGVGGTGGLGGNSADSREATAGGAATGRAAGGGGGGAGNLSNLTGGAGGASGAGYAGGAGSVASGGTASAGADRSADADPFARAGSGGGGGGASVGGGFSDNGGLGGAGGRYGAGAGAPGVCANGATNNGTAGPSGYVVVVTTIRAGDLSFGATLEIA